MGVRGPAPEPTALKVLKGGKGNLPSVQITDAIHPLVEIPECPRHLGKIARAEWYRLTPQLQELRIISQMDMAALAAYCLNYERHVTAEIKLKKLGFDACIDTTPSGYKQISVLLQISNRSLEIMHKLMGEFGMTPSSRSGNRITPSSRFVVQGDLFAMEADNNDASQQPAQGPGRFFQR